VLSAFAFNVLLDAIDGPVARTGTGPTRFGAVFDREVDALFVLVAYLYFHLAGHAGLWVLIPGLLPYAYRLAVVATARRVPAEGREWQAAALAGLNFLLLLLAAAVPARSASILALSATVVVVSFSASFWNLYRHAHPVP
jgi:phosphatidylglycerophosphate synthase